MIKEKKICIEYVNCCMGCEENDEILFSAHDLLHNLPGEFNVVKCMQCNLIRTNPRPTPESIGYYYPENYGPYKTSIVKKSVVKNYKYYIKKFLRTVIKIIFNFKGEVLPKLIPGNMLEIGCASGSFLHKMAEKGWKVKGIEFDHISGQEARKLGYSVHIGSLEDAPKPIEKFDLIVGWMVIEHLHAPDVSLRKLSEWANVDAFLVISVPNAGSFEFRLFKKNGYALQLPTHLYHFTPQTIKSLLQASGWKLEKIYHQRTISNIIGSIGYVLSSKGYKKIGNWCIKYPEKGGPLVYLLFPISLLLSIFGQTGRMTILAKKYK